MSQIAFPETDYTPLREALKDMADRSRASYKEIATAADCPFPRLLSFMNGGEARFNGCDVVNLCRLSGVPLGELIPGGSEGERHDVAAE